MNSSLKFYLVTHSTRRVQQALKNDTSDDLNHKDFVTVVEEFLITFHRPFFNEQIKKERLSGSAGLYIGAVC